MTACERRISDWSSDVCSSGLVDANAVEALRVAALGKAGSITALLKTLGGMSPEERQAQGPAIHALRERVTAALAARKAVLDAAALDVKLAAEAIDKIGSASCRERVCQSV